MRHDSDKSRVLSEGFGDLLNGFCNGRLDAQQLARFDQTLRREESARAAYLDYMAVEAELYACRAGSADRVGGEAPGSPAAAPDRGASQRRRVASWLAIAASLIGVAVASSLATRAMHAGHSASPAASAPQQATADTVARVSATQNCRWRDPDGRIGYGATLVAGQRLDLEAGVAEIAFANGATILLEGPASLEIDDDHNARLVSGRLAAKIPREAQRLAVRVGRIGVGGRGPAAEGAEFGLLSDGRGGGEVHVFDGSVNARFLNQFGAEVRSLQLRPREAARVRPASTTVSRFQANGDRFVRSLSSGGPRGGLYAFEAFDYPKGPLSWQNGGFGWAGPWADIEAGDNPAGGATNLVGGASVEYRGVTSVGNHAVQTAQRNRIRRVLSTSIGGVFDAAGLVENRDGHRLLGRDGRRLYLSFLQRVDKLDDGFYGFELHRGDGNGNRVLCIGNGAEGAGYGVTSNYNAYGPRNFPPLGEETRDANLFVIRIDFGVDDRDRVFVYRNPESLLDEGRCEADARLMGNFAFDRIGFGNFDGAKRHEIDGVRIGTTFRAVTGQRDPSGVFEGRVADKRWPPAPGQERRLSPTAAGALTPPPHPQAFESLVF
ncbi:MAG: hypothetical protein AAGB00_09745 [Planctomycetota bacterium]